MVVEIPLNTNIKYEFDKNLGKIRCDRVLNTSMIYPGNYGYFPNTLSGYGGPLDVLLVSNFSLYPESVINVKMIGALITKDEAGEDKKIIAVPSNKVDKSYENINNILDLQKNIIEKIKHFFKHYKYNQKSKWIEIGEFLNLEKAIKVYEDAKQNYIIKSKI
tara:strand:- start:83 stop:568 length:486 start_codon:yes stop_codon:yes gene_type:complete